MPCTAFMEYGFTKSFRNRNDREMVEMKNDL